MRNQQLWVGFLRISVFVGLSTVLWSTALAGALSGKVRDEQGRALPGIHVQLQGQGVTQSTVSDSSGEYRFDNLSAGPYSLAVRELGFESETVQLTLTAATEKKHDLLVRLELLEQRVVVTATRNEVSTSLLGNSVTVISGEEARQASQLSDLLRTVSGLHIVQTGTPGAVTSLYLRGGESDYSKVLLDGIPLNQPGGFVDLSNLTTAGIERIEVVRGPQSALYGSDAIAGVVQIFTQKADEEITRPRVELTLEGGNYSTLGTSGRVSGKTGRLSYTGLFSHLETDNSVPNSFFNNNTATAMLGLDIAPDTSLSMIARGEYGRAGVPGPTLFGPADLEEYYRKRNSLFGANFSQRLSPQVSHRFMYSQAQINELSEDPVDSGTFIPSFEGRTGPLSFDFPYSFLNATRKQVAGYHADFTASGHVLATGIEYEHERGVVGEGSASRSNFGYYLQDQWMPTTRLALTGGVRLDRNGSFGFAATPRFSVAWLLRNGGPSSFWGMTRPKFNFGLGIKEPSLVESFSTNPFFRGNPDLEPERTRSVEVGIEQRLAGNRVRVEVNGFYNHFIDQIDILTTDAQTFEASYFNIGRSQAWGVEHVLEIRANQAWRVIGGYTYLNTRILETASPFHPVLQAGSRLLRRPTHSGFVTAGWFKPRWGLSSRASFIGKRTDNDFYNLGLQEVAGYVRVDLNGSFQITERVDLFAAIQNMLDSDYPEVLGYPALKFNFRTGMRIRF